VKVLSGRFHRGKRSAAMVKKFGDGWNVGQGERSAGSSGPADVLIFKTEGRWTRGSRLETKVEFRRRGARRPPVPQYKLWVKVRGLRGRELT